MIIIALNCAEPQGTVQSGKDSCHGSQQANGLPWDKIVKIQLISTRHGQLTPVIHGQHGYT